MIQMPDIEDEKFNFTNFGVKAGHITFKDSKAIDGRKIIQLHNHKIVGIDSKRTSTYTQSNQVPIGSESDMQGSVQNST